MKKSAASFLLLLCFTVACCSFFLLEKERPVIYIIGDSTVRNGSGNGANKQWGWGSFINEYFDTTKIGVRNEAIGGRSSRTFLTEGRWDKIMKDLKKGDYVFMQFGHNDSGPLDDTSRARGSIRGIGDESKDIFNPITKKPETVYTYGWYLRKYIREAKAKGAIPVVCSPVPRNDWKEGKVLRSAESYGKWAREVAAAEGVNFIDLNNLVAVRYEAMGADSVKPFFPIDHTHTNIDGAKLNAAILMEALKGSPSLKLNKYLVKQ